MVYRIKLFQRWKKDHAMKDKKRFEILLKVINRIYNENCEIHELIDASIIDVCTEEEVLPEQFFFVCVKRITLCNCLCFSSPSSCDFASVIRNIGKFGAKTANTIDCFRESVPVLKIHGCYQDTQKFEQPSIPIQAIQGENSVLT